MTGNRIGGRAADLHAYASDTGSGDRRFAAQTNRRCVLPDPLAQVALRERIGSFPANGVRDIRGCHTAITPEGSMPLHHHDEIPGTGGGMLPACGPAMKRCAPADASDGLTGRNGSDITCKTVW